MKKAIIILLISIFSSTAFATDRNIMNHCENKWGNNYRMLKYCVSKQEEAKRSLNY